MTPEQQDALVEFARWVIQHAFDGCDVDGWEVQKKATRLGLLTKTTYDPAIHGEANSDWIEPGDDFYVFSDIFPKGNP